MDNRWRMAWSSNLFKLGFLLTLVPPNLGELFGRSNPCQHEAALEGGLAILDGIHRLPLGTLAGALGALLCDRGGVLPDGTKMVPEARCGESVLSGRWTLRALGDLRWT